MPRSRTGTFEPSTVAGIPYRGRLRLFDGTKSERFDLPADMTEKQARAYLAGCRPKRMRREKSSKRSRTAPALRASR
jgi:hypothetical protein